MVNKHNNDVKDTKSFTAFEARHFYIANQKRCLR